MRVLASAPSRSRLGFAAALVLAATMAQGQVGPAEAGIGATRRFLQASISPDGSRVVYVEALGGPGESAIYVAGGVRISASAAKAVCSEHSPAWSPDSSRIAFLSDCDSRGQLQLYVAPASGGPARRLTRLTGLPDCPRWSPGGDRIAILFTEDLPRSAGPLDPVLPTSGLAESKIYEQRLAVVEAASGATRQLSPPDMYVYEYDWSPDGRNFAATAAAGAGDDNWWIAQLYTISAGDGRMRSLYKPEAGQQLAVPRWSPDGASVLFIGGLMSDQGSTGGEIFQVAAAGGRPRSLTPGIDSSVSDFAWPRRSRQLYFAEHYDGGSAISMLDPEAGRMERLWKGEESLHAGFDDSVLSLPEDGRSSVVIRSSWSQPPEVWRGPIGKWEQVTRENSARKPAWGQARSLHWTSDGFRVQGWLLYPANFDPNRKYPLVVSVHGGPASSQKPSWPRPGYNPVLLAAEGYFVLLPNPRGSFGQGDKFTRANVKDFGGGDFRDILTGVDEALRAAPIDPERIGITGWSYGGFMTMWAVTQTGRFRAAVAGAGIANWQSYYGQNAIDQWMIPYFGASVYDDPAVYAKSSPITFIKRAKTPALVLVGEGDGECPPPQSYEFWHALKTLGVPTRLVVYPGEGHRFSKPENQRDVLERMAEWFNRYLR